MAGRRRFYKKFRRWKRVGWVYPTGRGFARRGLFCPYCGQGLWMKIGVRRKYVCFNCNREWSLWDKIK